MKRKIHWLVFNVLLAWCAWEAVMNLNPNATQLMRFVLWLAAFATVSTMLISELRLVARARGRSLPPSLTVTFDITFICFLAWHGWWGCLTAALLTAIAEAGIYDESFGASSHV